MRRNSVWCAFCISDKVATAVILARLVDFVARTSERGNVRIYERCTSYIRTLVHRPVRRLLVHIICNNLRFGV